MLGLVVMAVLVLAAPAQAAGTNPGNAGAEIALDVAVKRFAVAGRQVVGRGELTAKLSDDSGAIESGKRNVRFAVAAKAGNCRVQTLKLDDLQLDLLGLSVDVSTVNLRLYGVPRGDGSGVVGRLFCSLARSTIRLRGSIGAANQAKKTARALNSKLRGRPMRTFGARALLASDPAQTAQYQGPSCKVLRLLVGPLDLNLLGLVVELYGEKRTDPITLTITAFPGQGTLGDLFCQLAGGPST